MADSPLERTSFFSGQLLTAEDFTREQNYIRDKQKRHNRTLHGFGIVSGLKVSIAGGQIVVDAGLALDCEGNEIVVGSPVQLSPLSSDDSARTAYVNIRYSEEKIDPVPDSGPQGTCPMQFSTIRESFEICIGEENYTRGHRHLRARWIVCGQPHALTIAKLRKSPQGWRVDRRYRPPFIK